jgi:hypothetical protein
LILKNKKTKKTEKQKSKKTKQKNADIEKKKYVFFRAYILLFCFLLSFVDTEWCSIAYPWRVFGFAFQRGFQFLRHCWDALVQQHIRGAGVCGVFLRFL